jgi:hypothetical protein
MSSKPSTFVQLDLIASKIMRHPLMKNITYEDIIDHTVSVLRLVKAPGVLVEDSCFRDLINHKARIPSLVTSIKSVSFVTPSGNVIPMTKSSNVMLSQIQKFNTKNAYYRQIELGKANSIDPGNDPSIAARTGPGVLQGELVKDNSFGELKYMINGQAVVCSEKDGKVFISFERIHTDDDGIPLVPNSESLIKAIAAYIKIQVFEVLFDLGKLNERSVSRAETEYAWYIGQAQTEFQGLSSYDEMESFINEHVRLFNVSSLHSENYESSSDKEFVNIL